MPGDLRLLVDLGRRSDKLSFLGVEFVGFRNKAIEMELRRVVYSLENGDHCTSGCPVPPSHPFLLPCPVPFSQLELCEQ